MLQNAVGFTGFVQNNSIIIDNNSLNSNSNNNLLINSNKFSCKKYNADKFGDKFMADKFGSELTDSVYLSTKKT